MYTIFKPVYGIDALAPAAKMFLALRTSNLRRTQPALASAYREPGIKLIATQRRGIALKQNPLGPMVHRMLCQGHSKAPAQMLPPRAHMSVGKTCLSSAML
jgi:hypothetical protein